jgi:hypothetical protein
MHDDKDLKISTKMGRRQWREFALGTDPSPYLAENIELIKPRTGQKGLNSLRRRKKQHLLAREASMSPVGHIEADWKRP